MTAVYDVHVLGSDGKELRCVRVPVTATSTVRQLASDCLSRFIAQTRFAEPNIEVIVDDVTSAGCSLFFNDPVGAVVRPTEVLAVHIQNVTAADVQPRRIAASSVAAAASPADASLVKAPQTSGEGGATAQVRPLDNERTRAKRARRTETPLTEPAAERQPRVEETLSAKPKTSAVAKELGWGEQSHKAFDPNYVSDPDAMVRELRKRQAACKKQEKLERMQGGVPVTLSLLSKTGCSTEPHSSAALPPASSAPCTVTLSKLELYCNQPVIDESRPSNAAVARRLFADE